MIAGEPSFPDKITLLDSALTAADIEHAFGGALALAYYAEPRATIDIDVNVFIPVEDRGTVTAAVEPLEIQPGGAKVAHRDGWERMSYGRTPVDVFYAYDPFHEAMRTGRRLFEFNGKQLPFLAAEHLVACKAIFDRPKDWIDLDQMLIGVPDLDATEALRWVEHVVGSDDARHQKLSAAVARIRGVDER